MRILLDAIFLLKRSYNIVFIVLAILTLLVSVAIKSYFMTVDEYIWLFLSATTILVLITIYSMNKWYKNKIPGKDVLGNIGVTCFGVYFVTIVVAAILQNQ